MTTIPITELEQAAYEAGLETGAIYPNYSGRGMYGDTCLGLVHHDQGELLAFMTALAANSDDVGWTRNARSDNMGLSQITYWPGVKVEDDQNG